MTNSVSIPALGPPPRYSGRTNMEYAAPGTSAWAQEAWDEIERLRADLNVVGEGLDTWRSRALVAEKRLANALEEEATG